MCDSLCRLGPEATLFAKSSDRPVGEVQLLEAQPSRPPGGTVHTQYLELPDAGAVAVLGSRPGWLWGFEHGVNENAVAIGNERVWTTDDPAATPVALIGMDLVRLALEQARSADEALHILTTALTAHGQGGVADASTDEAYFSSFLLADRTGAWVVETSGRTWAAEPVAEGAGRAISNGLSIGDGWTKGSEDLTPGCAFRETYEPTDLVTGHVDVRLAVTASAATTAREPWALRATLRDHGRAAEGHDGVQPLPDRRADFDGTGVSVCMHIRGFEATAASMIAELPRDPTLAPRVRCAVGSPCVSAFLPAWVDVGPPSLLGQPATWRAVDELRAGVEHVTDQIGAAEGLVLARAIRAVLDPVEDELDEEARSLADAPANVRLALLHRADDALRGALADAARLVEQVRSPG